MHQLFLLLGSNEGDRLSWLRFARQQIAGRIGEIGRNSHLYVTAPWGNIDQPDFINQALIVFTPLELSDILREVQVIEHVAGRARGVHWGQRTLDIDILFFDQVIVSTDVLTVPHPRLQDRRFALEPLAEIAPEYIHPVLGATILKLLQETSDQSEVSILPSQ